MTHHTDADRAEYEAIGISKGWNMTAIMLTSMPPKFSSYVDSATQRAFESWQAARRATAVPVNEAIRDVMHLIDDWSEKDFVAAEARLDPWSENDPSAPMQMIEKLDGDAYSARLAIEQKLRALLAAAPQPPDGLKRENPATKPEAAPVELPEYGIDTANHGGVRVRGYTKQQVRDLLAAHGIEVAP